jgi:thiol-disulfide isomerase/thioredoxin
LLADFVLKLCLNYDKMSDLSSKSYFDSSRHVQELTPKNFDDTHTWRLKSDALNKCRSVDCGCCVILFYAPWCPHCKKMKDVWEELGKIAKFFDVYAFNCEKYQERVGEIREEMPSLITSFPTMVVYQKGEPTEHIGMSDRSLEGLLEDCMRVCGSKV